MKKFVFLLILLCNYCYADDTLNLVCSGQQKITVTHPNFSESISAEIKSFLIKNRKWNKLDCHEWTNESIFCVNLPKELYKDKNYLLNASNYHSIRIDRVSGMVSQMNLSKNSSSTVYVTFDGRCSKSSKPKF